MRAAKPAEVRGLLDRLEGSSRLNIDLPVHPIAMDGPASPRSGDHIFFTGVVWTPLFTDLFGRLANRQVEFSVLLHDIIPVESPELCGESAVQSFVQWLTVVVANARTVFVSGSLIRDKVLRWAALAGVPVLADIVVLPFGLRKIENALSAEQTAADPRTSSIDLRCFVLSVGTIDTRKNQLFLCKVWQQLIDSMGTDKVPQLVLAGRDDLNISAVPGCATLLATGKLLVLEGLSDRQIAALYDNCLFTAFPSLSEGYGLPVVESLLYGKLCLSADLPAVREHAGDLAWYFSTDDVEGTLPRFAEAISHPHVRVAAEQRIRQSFRVPTWAECYLLLATEAASSLWLPAADVSSSVPAESFPGASEISVSDALAKSLRWCRTDNPDVSILIINWNSLSATMECVRQIWAATDGHTYEIIIADNGSAPHEARRLKARRRNSRSRTGMQSIFRRG